MNAGDEAMLKRGEPGKWREMKTGMTGRIADWLLQKKEVFRDSHNPVCRFVRKERLAMYLTDSHFRHNSLAISFL